VVGRELAPSRTQPVINVSFQLFVIEVLFDRLHVPSQLRTQVFNPQASPFRVTYSLAAGLADADVSNGPQQVVRSQLVGDEELKPVGV
jgi:hypothetical protein